MNKFLNYVKNGKGIGLLFLLAAAVIVSIIYTLTMKEAYFSLRPDIINVADKFLPITVKGGKIVDPINTHLEYSIDLGLNDNGEKVPFKVILDTRDGASYNPINKFGIFIFSDVILLGNMSNTQRFQLSDGNIDKDIFGSNLDKFIRFLTTLMSLVIILVYFVLFLLKAVLIALIAKFSVGFLKTEEFDFKVLLRLGALIVTAIEIITFGLLWIAIFKFSFWQSLLFEIIAGISIIYTRKLEM